MRMSPFLRSVRMVSQILTFVTLQFSTISFIMALRFYRYLILVSGPQFSVCAMSLPEPNGSATNMIFPISVMGSST